MKSNRDLRGTDTAEDLMKKAVKLDPIRKNGREKRAFINDIDDDDDTDLTKYKRESALDYLDDEEEEE